MSSAGSRERILPLYVEVPDYFTDYGGMASTSSRLKLATGKQKTVSESHRINRKTGKYNAGGPFYTSRVAYFAKPGHLEKAYWFGNHVFYTGPVLCSFPNGSEKAAVGFKNTNLEYEADNTSSITALGATAISQTSPTNKASNLATSLAEMHREGIPSLPGIETWKKRTNILKGAGSEYLNAEFGWLPLASEVTSVRDAARNSRDIMNQYHHGEGRNTHRRFDFPSQRSETRVDSETEWPLSLGLRSQFVDGGYPAPRRSVSFVSETKRWFEGCYTYALPSSTDSWRKGIGFGSDADQLFGLTLTPDVLWELTPWSWAVDWFSNAGDVINNVTNIGLAGLVLRYGYLMEETSSVVTAEVGPAGFYSTDSSKVKQLRTFSEPCSCGFEVVTKRRVPASPFGFSIGWEGLSPTQLAITAALGITKLL